MRVSIRLPTNSMCVPRWELSEKMGRVNELSFGISQKIVTECCHQSVWQCVWHKHMKQ